MAWRKMTEDDLAASITQAEINVYKKSASWKTDPIEALIKRTATMVRTYIRTNGKIVMSPDAEEVPESCVAHAMSFVAFDLSMRLGGAPNEGKKLAREEATKFFNAISRRWVTVEDYERGEDAVTGGAASVVVSSQPSKLGHMEGL